MPQLLAPTYLDLSSALAHLKPSVILTEEMAASRRMSVQTTLNVTENKHAFSPMVVFTSAWTLAHLQCVVLILCVTLRITNQFVYASVATLETQTTFPAVALEAIALKMVIARLTEFATELPTDV